MPVEIAVGLAEHEALIAGTVVTLIVVVAVAPPLVPEQEILYVVVVVGETMIEPDVALLVEKLVPVQEAALRDDHASVVDCPSVSDVDEAASVAVTVVDAVTATIVWALAVPPDPLHETTYVASVSGATDTDPAVWSPVEKLVPVQTVASVDDHESTDVSLEKIDDGLAENVIVGAGV